MRTSSCSSGLPTLLSVVSDHGNKDQIFSVIIFNLNNLKQGVFADLIGVLTDSCHCIFITKFSAAVKTIIFR